jgi:hypothetical protein
MLNELTFFLQLYVIMVQICIVVLFNLEFMFYSVELIFKVSVFLTKFVLNFVAVSMFGRGVAPFFFHYMKLFF